MSEKFLVCFFDYERKKAIQRFLESQASFGYGDRCGSKKLWRDAMPRWTLHDLRRTGRSLMSRAKVPSDHAKRVMGHVMGGVRETYDRYEYLEEKWEALSKVSNLLTDIVRSSTLNLARAA
jgi:integrase